MPPARITANNLCMVVHHRITFSEKVSVLHQHTTMYIILCSPSIDQSACIPGIRVIADFICICVNMLYILSQDVNQKAVLKRKRNIKIFLYITAYPKGSAVPGSSRPETDMTYIKDNIATTTTVRAISKRSHRSIFGFLFLIARYITIA